MGLRVAANHSDRFDRFVVANTFLPTCDDSFFKVNDGFYGWKKHAPTLVAGEIGDMMVLGTAGPSYPDLSEEEKYGYSAPFPSDEYKAGARRFPEIVPTAPRDPTGRQQTAQAENNKAAWEVFKAWRKPVLTAFSDSDNVMVGGDQVWLDNCPGCAGQPHVTIKGCGHFLQDGGADQLTAALVEFVQKNPGAKARL